MSVVKKLGTITHGDVLADGGYVWQIARIGPDVRLGLRYPDGVLGRHHGQAGDDVVLQTERSTTDA